VELHRDDVLAVWLICWMDEQDTGFHDHDLSAGAVAVVDGAVAEDRLVLGGAPETRVFSAGAAFSFTAADIHRVRHAGTAPAVTIHAYSPPLWRMGAYEILPGGQLRRHSLSYAEELRPLDGDEVLRPFGG
jgi:predicted metal-dependent enzyme (double-stranded beta helix superfamily)